MPQYTQDSRVFRVTTPFGEDTLLFGSMKATEPLSGLFELDLTLFSEQGHLDADGILLQPVSVAVFPHPTASPLRYFHGLATDFEQVGWDERLNRYRVIVRPWLWFLTHMADCRVFQNKKVPEIFDDVCRQAGFTDFRLALTGTYEPWEYCVQFRETDFNFVSRLLEQEGIFYYFEHSHSKHELVLCDDVATLSSAPGYEEVPFWAPGGVSGNFVTRDSVGSWSCQKSFHSGQYATREFNFKKPTDVLESASSIARAYDCARFETFDFPALAATQTSAAVKQVAKIRVQELQTPQMVARGKGDALGLATGRTFTLTEHPREDFNMKYLVRSTTIDMRNNSYFAGSGSGPTRFEIEIEALDTCEAFRPTRTARKPLVHGLQTALVVGPAGAEIYTDQYGRVKVQFHWDRQGKNDEHSSCWIRVGQGWAGRNWGAVQIPRVRQEVIVAFLDGDPDRPMIIGSVYNGSNMPPYGLPENATRSGVKSRSSMGGTSDNFNEIRFEDKRGEEQLYIHAEKDHEVVVNHEMTVTVGGNQGSTIAGSAVIKARTITLETTTGAASITLNEAGAVEIKGVTVTINSAATVIAGASTDITGEINIEGTGMITGLVVIPAG